ncbi:D-serine deaminase-like pyridoxal phosphate-dependent protein [Humitalea rosea]|uniref:D-serine deaminase-like pyridoxal phosphate-dependent protein n=1 Tax=Humitalea rosea TaxID=990373 RepID=A0A2W7III1_9PROT|nr:alanine racemase [Humitalea rosea]PZW46665.1 D-serine deaminase-like pyridoxal phosphate-dependent protein [Humitalea rosea]
MTLDDLTTPCLVLDLGLLRKNLAMMEAAVARHPGVVLRPHLKTAKSIEVAALAAPGHGPITVSTLAEAEAFWGAGYRDQIYAVGITPQKLDRLAALPGVKAITDDLATAQAIAAHPGAIQALVEVDVGEHRGGLRPDDEGLLAIAAALGPKLAGVITHAGHSYAGRTNAEMADIAETERAGITRAAERLRAAGHSVGIVSMGSSPTALYARSLEGVTEVRAGVYMFGDLFQAQIGTHAEADIAMTVLTSVIGRRAGTLLLDAGAMALSKDRSTAAPGIRDDGFGLVLDLDGQPSFGRVVVERAYQEHGVATGAPDLPVGARVRVQPNHTCMTAGAHERYFVVDGGREVIGTWARVNGW